MRNEKFTFYVDAENGEQVEITLYCDDPYVIEALERNEEKIIELLERDEELERYLVGQTEEEND